MEGVLEAAEHVDDRRRAVAGGRAGLLAASEQGDAGDLPASAQDLSGEVVPTLDGSLADGLDQDPLPVCLTGGGSFSATTVGGTSVDTQLFLFDGQGLGVYANDDSAGTRQSTLPADAPLTPAAGGQYLLAISPYNRDPQSPLGPIFPDRPSVVGATERLGPGAQQLERAHRAPGAYTIVLTGTTACSADDTTPPAIDLRAPRDGETVARGASVLVDYSCSDEGGSGLASCIGTVADGEPLDTGTVGVRTVTVRARDNAGNESEVTHSVTVRRRCADHLPSQPARRRRVPARSRGPRRLRLRGRAGRLGLLSCEGRWRSVVGSTPPPWGSRASPWRRSTWPATPRPPRASTGWSSTSASGRGPRAAGRQRAARRSDAAGEVLARRLSRPP